MDRRQEHFDPKIDEIRMISSQNSRDINSRTGHSRHRSCQPSYETSKEPGNYFSVRLVICIFLFMGYCFMAKEDRILGQYDSVKIKEMIQTDMDVEACWRELENSPYAAAFFHSESGVPDAGK